MRLAASLESFANRFAAVDHNHEQLAALVELIEGAPADVLHGRPAKKGMGPKVDEMYRAFKNGGIAVRLPAWSKLMGFVLVVMQIALTVVLIVQATRPPG